MAGLHGQHEGLGLLTEQSRCEGWAGCLGISVLRRGTGNPPRNKETPQMVFKHRLQGASLLLLGKRVIGDRFSSTVDVGFYRKGEEEQEQEAGHSQPQSLGGGPRGDKCPCAEAVRILMAKG